MKDQRLPPHPFYLFTEFQSDLGILIREIEDVIAWAAEVGDGRRKRQLTRIAILYVAFAAQSAIELRASAGRMTKKFNEFENNRIQGKQIGFPAQGRTKQLRRILDRTKWARNMIAHPYRADAEGRDRPMNLAESFRLEQAAAELTQLAAEVNLLKDAYRELYDWFGQAMVAGATRTDWLGGGNFRTRF